MSLRHKLVLLMSGLAVLALALAMGAAYGDVRGSARAAADERLGRAVQQLAGLAERSTAARRRIQEEMGTSPALRSMLRGEPADTAEVLEALRGLRSAADSGLAIRLVDGQGRFVFSDLPEAETPPLAAPPLDTTPTYGPLRRRGGEVRYWNTAPVRGRGGDILGWVVQERRIGNPGTAAQIEDLIGSGSRVVFAIPGDSLAVTLAGEGIRMPVRVAADTLLAFERDGTGYLARAGSVPGTPWVVVVEMPASVVGERAAAFLGRMSALGVLLVGATVLLAWAIGRRMTGPIEELVEASEAVARGDYTEKVNASRGGDELTRLARSFNEMAGRVAASRAELEERLAQERALARELEAAGQRADEARQEAQRANRAKSDFLATMSHEVRTPINAVLGYCDLLEMEISGPLTTGQKEKVDRIRRSSRLLGALVEDVLDFARLDSGRLRIDTTTAPVRDAVLAASAVLEPQARREGLVIEVDVPGELRFVGDPQRVEQILVNLLSNAVKFTESGGVAVLAGPGNGGPPSRSAPRTPTGDWVRVDVKDTGEGIPVEDAERVFEPFVQGETGFTRRHGGTGLGLSISRELARIMGGDLTLRSRPGDGSCFTLWLPAGDGGLPAQNEG